MLAGTPGLRTWKRVLSCMGLLLVLLPGGRLRGAEETRTVILLKSSVPERRALTDFASSYYDELSRLWPGKLQFFTEDVTPRPGPYEKRYEWLKQKYQDQRIDLVVVFGDVFADVGFDHRTRLWPASPVLLAGISTPRYQKFAHRPNATAITLDQDVKGALEMARRFCPKPPMVTLVSGVSPTDTAERERWIKQVEELAVADKTRFEHITATNRPKALELVRELPAGTLVIFREVAGRGTRNPPGKIKFLNDLSAAAPGPLFSLVDDAFEHEAVGTVCVDYTALGVETAKKTLDVFKSGDASQVPASASRAFGTVFDARQLQRWGLDEKLVPPGSVLTHRTPGLWETHRETLISVGAALALQLLLIGVLLNQASRHRRAKQELDEQLRFEKLAAEISSEFVNLPAEQFRGRIEHSLELVCNFLGFDAAAVVVFMDNSTRAEVRHLWRRDPTPEVTQMMTDKQFPWTFSEQLAGRYICFSDPSELPEVAATDRMSYAWLRLRTLSNVTLSAGATVVGALPMATQARAITVTPLMRRRQVLIGEILANAILRERSERELRAGQERLSLATTAAKVGVWSWNIAKGSVDATDDCKRMFGFTPETAVSLDMFLERVHAGDRLAVRHALENAVKDKSAYDVEYRILLPGGETRWIAARGCVQQDIGPASIMLGVVIDITERRRADEMFRLAVEASPNAIVMVNQAGQIVLVNSQTEKAFGYQREELLGQPVEMLLPERVRHHHPDFRKAFFQSPEQRPMGAGRELYARRKDGSEFPVEIGLNPIQSAAGPLVLSAIIDITERRKMELQTQRHREELAHVSRVSIMGELSASMAHELNQPLTAILTNAQAAQRFMAAGQPDLEEFREILKDIAYDTTRARDVIRHLRALVKKSAPTFGRLDLAETVREVVGFLHGDVVVRNVRVAVDIKPDLPPVHGDRIQLQQVLINLLLNAFDAMSQNPVPDRLAHIAVQMQNAQTLLVSIRDQGTGIAPDKLDTIFQPFYTTKTEGMGMGLSVTQSIVELHNGKIWAVNNPDRGATLHFTVPVAGPA